MSRPIVFIHGYSANGAAFDPLRNALLAVCAQRGLPLQAESIDICTYVSLNNEISVSDLAEGFDRALRNHPILHDPGRDFDAIVHSTGMLVLRAWLAGGGASPATNSRLKRLRHLVGIAPATWGSPQAHKGRTWLGAIIKGDKQLGPDFLNAGDRILEDLELGGAYTWYLAHQDLLAPEPFYSTGTDTPFCAVFIGNRGYQGLDRIADTPGSDGTVRWSGCALNTRKITLDLTREPLATAGARSARIAITPWASNRLEIPMFAVPDRDHGSILADPEPSMVGLIAEFLQLADQTVPYATWLANAHTYSEASLPKMLERPSPGIANALESLLHLAPPDTIAGWQQFVVHVLDTHNQPVPDYFIELFLDRDRVRIPCQSVFDDVHAFGPDNSFRCFHIALPAGASAGVPGLILRLHASTGTDLMAYQGYGDTVRQLTATAEPVELDLSVLASEAQGFFSPFTTTLIEIRLNREPLPLDQVGRILQFL